jgi:hypothetical protein
MTSKNYRFWVIFGVISLAIVATIQPAKVAEITCVSFDTTPRPYSPQLLEFMRKNYPSGRLPNSDTCIRVGINGTIVAGDFERFHELVRRNLPFLEFVVLNSPGGDVGESLKIGRLIRKALVRTQAPSDQTDAQTGQGDLPFPRVPGRWICKGTYCNCASACFLIWAAGIIREGNVLGLHRPTIQSTSFSSLPPDRASNLYLQLLADTAKYLNEMEIPHSLIEAMTNTSSGNMWWLSLRDAQALYVPFSIDEWLRAACGSFSPAEQATLTRDKLEKRKAEIGFCRAERIFSARDAVRALD